jgi:hypothetical protein
MSKYEPVRDASGKVIGALYVGVDVRSELALLKDKIRSHGIGKTGGYFVIDGKPGADQGKVLIDHTQDREGKNLLDAKDSAGQAWVREMIARKDGTLRHTLADTEGAHLAAFNQAFASAGLPWRWDESLYISLLEVSGGKERMAHYLAHHVNRDPAGDSGESTAIAPDFDALHAIKTTAYTQQMRAGALALRLGIEAMLAAARESGLRLASATTTTEAIIHARVERVRCHSSELRWLVGVYGGSWRCGVLRSRWLSIFNFFTNLNALGTLRIIISLFRLRGYNLST